MKEHLLSFFDNIPESDKTLIKGYDGSAVVDISCREFRSKVFKMATFLKEKGITAGDRIAVVSEKCPEIIISFYSIWLNQATCVPVCETLNLKELNYVINDAGVRVVLCSSSLKDHFKQSFTSSDISVCDFSMVGEVSNGNEDFSPSMIPDETAFLIYTSGSTGNPKGVILSHQNVYVNAVVSAEFIGMKKDMESVMSILPYWHSFALTAEIFTMFYVKGTICIPKNRSSFLSDMKVFKPTIVLSVPRLAEMLKNGIESSLKKKSNLQQNIFKLAQKCALKYHLKTKDRQSLLQKLLCNFFRKIVFQKVKEGFGGRLNYFIGGGAPLDASLQNFFLSIDLPMYQGYGLTETSPVISINAPHDFKVGSSGKIIPWLLESFQGDYTFEDEQGAKGKHLRGELLVKGKCVMKGYWNLEEETAQALKDGWLYTGDLACLDLDGFLDILGRKKNMLCLKGGEKFYPEFIEERLKSSPYISQAMVVGEGCTRASVLLNVHDDSLESLEKKQVDDIVSNEIKRLTNDLEVYQRPFGHLILPDFTQEAGLLTNTLKIRRHKIFERHGTEISNFLN